MRTLLLMWGSILLLSAQLYAQDRTITGKVVDPDGKPIPGASILVIGTKTGTSTLRDGTFSLAVPARAKGITVSAVGWADQTIELGTKTSFSISLTNKDHTLTEVVVPSLGIVRDKRSLGYATQQLKSDQIADKGSVNILNALEGKVSAAQITGASGSAGASVN